MRNVMFLKAYHKVDQLVDVNVANFNQTQTMQENNSQEGFDEKVH